jgi:hypothetical protein
VKKTTTEYIESNVLDEYSSAIERESEFPSRVVIHHLKSKEKGGTGALAGTSSFETLNEQD